MDGSKVNPVCPRCGGGIPNSESPGAYPGALSRTDNHTEICSDCGTQEAMEQFIGLDKLPVGPARDWWQKMRGSAWHAADLQ